MLALCLCMSMNRSYQSYYFVSLVSVWFLIIFLFMKVSPSSAMDKFSTNGALKMFIKFSVLLATITLLYLSEVFFERIFSIEPLIRHSEPFGSHNGEVNTDTDASIQAWWLHFTIDRYSVPAGMIFAYLMWLLRVHDIISVSSMSIHGQSSGHQQQTNTSRHLHLPKSAPTIMVSSSILGILVSIVFT